MSETWIKSLFGTIKPVIAMAHLPALPGTPRYDPSGGIEALLKHVKEDIKNLESGGVDAIMFCNEDDRPYSLKATIEQIAVMTRLITELAPSTIPFGVDFLWDPMAALAVAFATGASFVREVLTGTYESDMGLWSPDASQLLRYRHMLGADHIKLLNNIEPEFAVTLGTRPISVRARSAVISSLADVILVSGPMAGMEPNLSAIKEVKTALTNTPLFLNTGAKAENIGSYLSVVDGVIVGSSLKVDGYTWNRVDPIRVKQFMDKVCLVRNGR